MGKADWRAGMPDIYDYDVDNDDEDYRAFLAAWLDAFMVADGAPSIRWLALRAGRSPGYLRNIAKSRFHMGLESVEPIGLAMGLDDSARDYLDLLVRYARTTDPAKRARLRIEIRRRQMRNIYRVRDLAAFKYLESWVNVAVREALALAGEGSSVSALAERCVPPVDAGEVEEALALLATLGFIEPDGDGWLRTHREIEFDQPAVHRKAVRSFHRMMLKKAADSVVLGRLKHVDGRSVAISSERLPALRERLRGLVDEFCENAPDESPPDGVFHLEVALFPLYLDPPAALPPEFVEEGADS